MPSLPYVTLDVFTKTRLGSGNQLAIVSIPSGTTITKEQEHLIAREFDYSETVFIYPRSDSATDTDSTKIAIWTTDQELPFAGHPTVGTGFYLLSLAKTGSPPLTLSIPAGLLPVTQLSNGRTRVSAPHKITRYNTAIPKTRIQQVISGIPDGIASNGAEGSIGIVDGMNFVFVNVETLEAIAGLHPVGKDCQFDITKDLKGTSSGSQQTVVWTYVYVVTSAPSANDKKMKLRTRMFFNGDQEDAATGSAACALTSFLSIRRSEEEEEASEIFEGLEYEYEITQGVEMGRRSEIGVTVKMEKKGVVDKVYLEGDAVKVMEGLLTV